MEEKQPHIVDVIFVLTLFGLFALSALALIVVGSRIYKNTVENMQQNYETRTISSYITEKIRQGECVSDFSLGNMEAIAIENSMSDRSFTTYLYTYDGYLRELLLASDSDFSEKLLPAGQKITELQSLSLDQLDDNIVRITFDGENGSKTSLLINTYSGE